MIDESVIAERYRLLAPHLSERELRLWAAAEAASHPRGGVAAVARVTGIAASTIRRAQRELEATEPAEREKQSASRRSRSSN